MLMIIEPLAKVLIRHSRGLYRESSILKNQILLDTRLRGYDGKSDFVYTFARGSVVIKISDYLCPPWFDRLTMTVSLSLLKGGLPINAQGAAATEESLEERPDKNLPVALGVIPVSGELS